MRAVFRLAASAAQVASVRVGGAGKGQRTRAERREFSISGLKFQKMDFLTCSKIPRCKDFFSRQNSGLKAVGVPSMETGV